MTGAKAPGGLPALFISTAVSGDIARNLGVAHYSYNFAAARFRTLLAQDFPALRDLVMPEYYATRAAMPAPPAGEWLHLIFRSTGEIRLLKPAWNIACFAWEFPVLKTETLPGEAPTANQAGMLNSCDEVWVASQFARNVLQSHGVAQVHVVPAPISRPKVPGRAACLRLLAGLPVTQLRVNPAWPDALAEAEARAGETTLDAALRQFSARAVLFLAILNPEDARKNLDALIRGFHCHRQEYPDSLLLLKLIRGGDGITLAEVAGGILRTALGPGTALADPGILICNAFLSEPEMTALYGAAPFYLCTSIAEGQNLPLLEAMICEAVAVSTTGTAMDDYLSADCAIPIASTARPNDDPRLAGLVAGRNFTVARASATDVAHALNRARQLSVPAREHLARAGREQVARLYGPAAVRARITDRLRGLGIAPST